MSRGAGRDMVTTMNAGQIIRQYAEQAARQAEVTERKDYQRASLILSKLADKLERTARVAALRKARSRGKTDELPESLPGGLAERLADGRAAWRASSRSSKSVTLRRT